MVPQAGKAVALNGRTLTRINAADRRLQESYSRRLIVITSRAVAVPLSGLREPVIERTS
jgi:hypothetical protein